MMSADFGGTPLGPAAAFESDGGAAGLSAYKWDVTSLITGNGAYTASYSGSSLAYGFALVVVYSDASLPTGTVIVNDGVLQVCGGGFPCSRSTTFLGGASGPGTLWLFTQADDSSGSGETIEFNGSTVGGPIDSNLGPYASLFAIPVLVTGADTATINSFSDWFGWHLAVLHSSGDIEQPIPEPGTFALLLSGAGLLALFRRIC